MKGEPPNQVMSAIRRVIGGEIHLSEGMTATLLRRLVNRSHLDESTPIATLSDREFEVFTMIGEGRGPREIAERLHVSPRTVETYRAHIKQKLNLHDAAGVRRYAIEWMRRRE
jgi:DNA-binding NarL/FixJ family response regulator